MARKPALAAVLLACIAGPGHAAADDLQEARAAYAASQFDKARQLWAGPAERGDPRAAIGLATMYDLGQGVKRDSVAAYRWYRRAADAGLAEAEFDVAVMRDTGDGVERDMAEAALWYARAAARGNRRAQYNLGQLYQAGDGVPRNAEAAESWFRVASAAVPAAADRLAKLRREPAPYRAGGAVALAPVRLRAPLAGSTLAIADSDPAAVELVWVPPAQPLPVRYFVQVVALADDGPAQPQEVFGRYVDETAILAPLSQAAGRYAWRVYTVSRDSSSYAASDWSDFAVKPP